MKRFCRYFFTAALFIRMVPAHGQTSCLPDYTALQTLELVEPSRSSSFVRPLVSKRADGFFTTKVRLEGQASQEFGGSLQMIVRFDPAFDGVSLPYNLFAVLVVADGEVLAWHDFTNGCHGAGIGFFPGRIIQIPSVKLAGGKAQKLQIMVWGRL